MPSKVRELIKYNNPNYRKPIEASSSTTPNGARKWRWKSGTTWTYPSNLLLQTVLLVRGTNSSGAPRFWIFLHAHQRLCSDHFVAHPSGPSYVWRRRILKNEQGEIATTAAMDTQSIRWSVKSCLTVALCFWCFFSLSLFLFNECIKQQHSNSDRERVLAKRDSNKCRKLESNCSIFEAIRYNKNDLSKSDLSKLLKLLIQNFSKNPLILIWMNYYKYLFLRDLHENFI